MGIEFEAKFIDIDKAEMTKKLKKLGCKLVHARKRYTRVAFQRCEESIRGYARIRDEGGAVKMTVKIYRDPKFPEEYEVTIKDSFETGLKFMRSLGIPEKAFQESYREKWTHPLVHEITFDDLPGIPTYMEVDCTSEANLNKIIQMLELDKSKIRYGAFDQQYLEYYGVPKDILNNHTPSLTFANIKKEIKATKNMQLLNELAASYQNNPKFGGKRTLSRTTPRTTPTRRVVRRAAPARATRRTSSRTTATRTTTPRTTRRVVKK